MLEVGATMGRWLGRAKPVIGKSHWCEGTNVDGTACRQIVSDFSDHCEAGHPNRLWASVYLLEPMRAAPWRMASSDAVEETSSETESLVPAPSGQEARNAVGEAVRAWTAIEEFVAESLGHTPGVDDDISESLHVLAEYISKTDAVRALSETPWVWPSDAYSPSSEERRRSFKPGDRVHLTEWLRGETGRVPAGTEGLVIEAELIEPSNPSSDCRYRVDFVVRSPWGRGKERSVWVYDYQLEVV
jgi:hypothetical protein